MACFKNGVWGFSYIYSGSTSAYERVRTKSPFIYNSEFPVFVGFYPSASGSRNFLFKIGSRFYVTFPDKVNQNSINLRCRKQITEQCKFRVTLRILNIQDSRIPGFYDKDNFLVKTGKFPHNCKGYDSETEAKLFKLL